MSWCLCCVSRCVGLVQNWNPVLRHHVTQRPPEVDGAVWVCLAYGPVDAWHF